MRLEGKMIYEIHYKGNNWVWREQRIQDWKDQTKVPKREINVIQNWSLGHTNPYTKHRHKYIGGSNICIIDETIMVSQYEKGAILNLKESWPQMNKVDPCSTIDYRHKNTTWIYVSAKLQYIKYDKVLHNLGNSKNDDATVGPRSSIQTAQKRYES